LRIRWTEHASKNALGIFDYIAAQSPAYAESVYERILARPSQLEHFPESGSIVPEYHRPDIRELLVYSFRLIYRIENDEVRVLTVIHGSRQSPPRQEELEQIG
jgi:toxin ParE1/3/4